MNNTEYAPHSSITPAPPEGQEHDPTAIDLYALVKPRLIVEYEPHFYKGDGYGSNGYIGELREGVNKATGRRHMAGDFELNGRTP